MQNYLQLKMTMKTIIKLLFSTQALGLHIQYLFRPKVAIPTVKPSITHFVHVSKNYGYEINHYSWMHLQSNTTFTI